MAEQGLNGILLAFDKAAPTQSNGARYRPRQATAEDINEICAIDKAATTRFKSIPELADLTESESLPASKVQRWLDAGTICVIEDEGQVVGFAATQMMDGVLFITEISVLSEYQGKGVGSLLIKIVCEMARDRKRTGKGETRVSLTTYADVPWNGPWYRKRGFREMEASHIGPKHVEKMQWDEDERNLVRPGYRRCCMLWEE